MAILVTARNLSKSFGSRPLFAGVSFTLAEGQRGGLIGPNGAGKTTLLRILAGADTPDAAPRWFEWGFSASMNPSPAGRDRQDLG